jgi:3-hydroxyacyl-CoA dehydrogenase
MSKVQRRENVACLHFFNPVTAMKLVELIRGEETSDSTFDSLYHFCQRIGKTPVKCKVRCTKTSFLLVFWVGD